MRILNLNRCNILFFKLKFNQAFYSSPEFALENSKVNFTYLYSFQTKQVSERRNNLRLWSLLHSTFTKRRGRDTFVHHVLHFSYFFREAIDIKLLSKCNNCKCTFVCLSLCVSSCRSCSRTDEDK